MGGIFIRPVKGSGVTFQPALSGCSSSIRQVFKSSAVPFASAPPAHGSEDGLTVKRWASGILLRLRVMLQAQGWTQKFISKFQVLPLIPSNTGIPLSLLLISGLESLALWQLRLSLGPSRRKIKKTTMYSLNLNYSSSEAKERLLSQILMIFLATTATNK